MPALDIATWRFVFAVPLVWIAVSIRGRQPLRKPLPRRGLLLAGSLMAVAAATGVAGIQLLPAAVYVLLFYCYPAIVALISVIRGERLARAEWFALGLTLVGIALTMPNLGVGVDGSNDNLLGVGFALVNALAVAIYYVVTSKLLDECDDTPRASAFSIIGSLVPLLVLALVRGLTIPSDLNTWLLLIGFALVSSVLPMVTMNAGIQRLGASRAAILSMCEPLLTLVWSFLFLGDVILPIQLMGGALILGSLVLLQLRQIKPTAEHAASPIELTSS
jgi:drug/metabolite transporter (DMT)-like permease